MHSHLQSKGVVNSIALPSLRSPLVASLEFRLRVLSLSAFRECIARLASSRLRVGESIACMRSDGFLSFAFHSLSPLDWIRW